MMAHIVDPFLFVMSHFCLHFELSCSGIYSKAKLRFQERAQRLAPILRLAAGGYLSQWNQHARPLSTRRAIARTLSISPVISLPPSQLRHPRRTGVHFFEGPRHELCHEGA
jgi:hypothetical protein